MQATAALKHAVAAMPGREWGPQQLWRGKSLQAVLSSTPRQRGQRGKATHAFPSAWEPAIREHTGLDREKALLLKIPRTALWDIAEEMCEAPPSTYPKVSFLRGAGSQ